MVNASLTLQNIQNLYTPTNLVTAVTVAGVWQFFAVFFAQFSQPPIFADFKLHAFSRQQFVHGLRGNATESFADLRRVQKTCFVFGGREQLFDTFEIELAVDFNEFNRLRKSNAALDSKQRLKIIGSNANILNHVAVQSLRFLLNRITAGFANAWYHFMRYPAFETFWLQVYGLRKQDDKVRIR